MDNANKLDTTKFNNILESFNLKQHVNGPTHKKGHTLDLIMTRAELVTNIEIRDPVLSDHSAVHCMLRLNKPPLEQTEIQYRENCNKESFNEDLKNYTLLLGNHQKLSVIVEHYEKTLEETLDKHAPLKRRMITYHPSVSSMVSSRHWRCEKTEAGTPLACAKAMH